MLTAKRALAPLGKIMKNLERVERERNTEVDVIDSQVANLMTARQENQEEAKAASTAIYNFKQIFGDLL